MKTKVTVLGEEPKEKELKPIEFLGCLKVDGRDVNYACSDVFLTPSSYTEIMLISKDYGSIDVFLCTKYNGEQVIMIGHFNDGVV